MLRDSDKKSLPFVCSDRAGTAKPFPLLFPHLSQELD